MQKTQTPSWMGFVLLLFGLPFLLVGIGDLRGMARSWRLSSAASRWPTAPAEITRVELVHDDFGEGTTYSVACDYAYAVGGQRFTGHRVGITGGSSSDYQEHRRRFDILDEHMRNGRPYPVRVNPEKPEQAILFPEPDLWMRAGIPFGLGFAFAGVVIEALAVALIREQKRRRSGVVPQERAARDRPPEEHQFRHKSSAAGQAVGMWFFSLIWNSIVSVFLVVFASEGTADVPVFARVIVGVFALIGVALLLSTLRATLACIIHGAPCLILESSPLRPGHAMKGALRVSKRPMDASAITASIVCTETIRGSESSTDRELSTTEVLVGDPRLGKDGRCWVPIAAELPPDAPELEDEDASIHWRLKLALKARFVGMQAEIELPVRSVNASEVRQNPEPWV